MRNRLLLSIAFAATVLAVLGISALAAEVPVNRTATIAGDGPADAPATQPCKAPNVKGGKVTRLFKNFRETCPGARDIARSWVKSGRGRREVLGLDRCKGTRQVSCMAIGAKGIARTKFRWTPAKRAPIKTTGCKSFAVGTAGFSKVRVAKVSCSEASELLDRTTLSTVRRGRKSWTYAGWSWSFRDVDENHAVVAGKRAGGRRISALFGVS